jgi:organic hydroperoxide reductase OsmC/OhrA
MEPFPHHYRVDTRFSKGDSTATLTSPGLPSLDSAPPREFGGSGEHWSPETLLVAAVADCFVLGFRAIADASRFEWDRLEVSVGGQLDRVDRKLLFTAFTIEARLSVPASSERNAMRMLEKAEDVCLVTNSLTAKIDFKADIRVTQ